MRLPLKDSVGDSFEDCSVSGSVAHLSGVMARDHYPALSESDTEVEAAFSDADTFETGHDAFSDTDAA